MIVVVVWGEAFVIPQLFSQMTDHGVFCSLFSFKNLENVSIGTQVCIACEKVFQEAMRELDSRAHLDSCLQLFYSFFLTHLHTFRTLSFNFTNSIDVRHVERDLTEMSCWANSVRNEHFKEVALNILGFGKIYLEEVCGIVSE